MNYIKTNWQNLPNTTTPINATNLNKMENGIADANGAIGVDAYDSTSTYAVGDLCIYNNVLYICTTVIATAEDFDLTHWQATNIVSAIVDNGSNANGYYIKFYDGTLIQYGRFNATTGTTRGIIEGWNLGIYVYETTKSFPINFINTNYSIFGSTNSANPYIYSAGIFNIDTVSSFIFRAISSNANYERPFSWLAMGRWK